MKYVEIVGDVASRWVELTESDLRSIGEFTRENVRKWVEGHYHTGVGGSRSWDDYEWNGVVPGARDFHAVCGDIDIPWADEASKETWKEYLLNPAPNSCG
jgi:hypothetical protein